MGMGYDFVKGYTLSEIAFRSSGCFHFLDTVKTHILLSELTICVTEIKW